MLLGIKLARHGKPGNADALCLKHTGHPKNYNHASIPIFSSPICYVGKVSNKKQPHTCKWHMSNSTVEVHSCLSKRTGYTTIICSYKFDIMARF